jgi:hypothetical protein
VWKRVAQNQPMSSFSKNIALIFFYQFVIDGGCDGLGSSELQLLPQTFILFLGFATSVF